MAPQNGSDLPNRPSTKRANGLFAELLHNRGEAERKEAQERASNNFERAEYWRGLTSGLEFALSRLSDSGWSPPESELHPDERFMLSIEISVSRRTGDVISRTSGYWSDIDEFDDVMDQIVTFACEIVNLNPEDYVNNPYPRRVRLRREAIPVIDTGGEPLILNASDVEKSQFVFDDGKFVTLKMPGGLTVRVEKIDLELGSKDC